MNPAPHSPVKTNATGSRTAHRGARCGAFLLALAGLIPATAPAQLTWGIGGNGGDGIWNTTTANWWNGAANVPWTPGTAIFAGTGGTVTSTFTAPAATALIFNVPGYTIQSGSVSVSGTSLTITTNESATISSTLSGPSATLVKDGAASLTVSGTNNFRNVQINAGEYRTSGFSSLFFSDVTLANAAGVTLTLGGTPSSTSIKSLSGGGTSGGILQPDAQARTFFATVGGSGVFGGILQDNGPGVLEFDFLSGNNFSRSGNPTNAILRGSATGLGTEILTNASTHSGPTVASIGNIEFSGNGSALNSAMYVSPFGTIRLDNTAAALGNRLSDSLDFTIKGGRLEYIGNVATSIDEQVGALKFSGATTISTTQTGAAALLTFASVARQNHGTIDFIGNGRAKWTGMVNDSTGIVGNYATAGNEWAVVGIADGRAEPLASYATDLNTALPTDHVKLSGGGNVALAAAATRATLNLQNSSGSTGTLDLGANVLTLSDGGLLASGTAANQIQNGTLQAGGDELVVVNRSNLTIAASIGQTVGGTALTKSGAGTLTLSGTNTYAGDTAINQGTLIVSSDANLGQGSMIEFNGGTLKAAQSFTSAKGFTRGTDLIGTIDTNGFDVAFSGPVNGAIDKTGAGTLTLSAAAKGIAYLSQGTLALPDAISGDVSLYGGTLLTSGTLSRLSLRNPATLDIGGPGAAAFTLDSFSSMTSGALTIRYDLGSGTTDSWALPTPFFGPTTPPNGSFLFDFYNLGGTTTGTSYTLITKQLGTPLNAALFGIAPTALAAGWNGTFSTTTTEVKITFGSVPEPASLSVFMAGLGLVGLRRFRRS